MTATLRFHPVTAERWPDLDRLFSASAAESLGNPSRCWCMEWRRPRQDWERGAGQDNRRAMRAFIEAGQVPGILAYDGDEPVGWCSVSPRPSLSRLVVEGEFRNPQRPDVWSIICFYVLETHHGRGVMKALVRAAVDHAVANGARIVEGYPTEPKHFGDGAGGSIPAFEAAGFREAHRISPVQVTMRYFVGN